jgi:hypothetical protein
MAIVIRVWSQTDWRKCYLQVTGLVMGPSNGGAAARVAREFDLGLFITEVSPRNFAIALSLQLIEKILKAPPRHYWLNPQAGVSENLRRIQKEGARRPLKRDL